MARSTQACIAPPHTSLKPASSACTMAAFVVPPLQMIRLVSVTHTATSLSSSARERPPPPHCRPPSCPHQCTSVWPSRSQRHAAAQGQQPCRRRPPSSKSSMRVRIHSPFNVTRLHKNTHDIYRCDNIDQFFLLKPIERARHACHDGMREISLLLGHGWHGV
jgi:hypothetical protein